MSKDYIQNFGIEGEIIRHEGQKGMKWGERHWQYPDGRFTPEGKERYFGKYQNKIEDKQKKSKMHRDKADEYKVNALLDSKRFLFAKPLVQFNNWRFEANSKKASREEAKAIRLMNKYIKNIKKIKIHDKDTKKYLETAKKYQDYISNYQNQLLKENKTNEIYSKLLNNRYYGKDNYDIGIV